MLLLIVILSSHERSGAQIICEILYNQYPTFTSYQAMNELVHKSFVRSYITNTQCFVLTLRLPGPRD
ncbi:hypothetical protein O6H91_Y537000 [Diphasiastrum complanatum]|nr:hypothetical protein O6H91_Y537000 [Diphasiastrum complanatum]